MHWVGNGFPVRSVFDYNGLGRELSPFLLLDYAAPYQFPPGNEKRGVGGHPHKGFETVTVAYQGELEHRDSSGGGGKIGAGDVQWMTAGNGIVHEEFHSQDFTRKGGTLQMVQLWVNLRAKDKSAKARLSDLAQGADSQRRAAARRRNGARHRRRIRRTQRRGENIHAHQSVGRESPRGQVGGTAAARRPHHDVSRVERRSRR